MFSSKILHIMSNNDNLLNRTDIFSHLTSLRYVPRWIVLFIDIALCAIAFFIADFIIGKIYTGQPDLRIFNFYQDLSIILFTQIVFFWIFHTYSGVLRYSGYVDAAKLLFAVSANVIVLSFINFSFFTLKSVILFYYYGLILYAGFSFLFLFFLRLAAKTFFDYFTQSGGKITPVMIYGTKTAAVGIAKMLSSEQADTKFKLVGFIDDDKKSTQRMIMGVKVYHFDEKIIKKTISKKARAIIISPTQLKKINPDVDLELFLSNNLQVLTAPPVSIWKNDMPTIKQIKSIQIEDLLERPKIDIDTDRISAEHKGKVILVTGAAGSIGSEIVNQIISYKPQLIVLLDQAESPMHNLRLELEEKYPDQNISVFLADVRNKERMEYMMDMYRPDYVYHAAAYKHVPLMEDNPVESIQANVKGTKTIADLAVKYKVQRFVMVSTDKAVNPTNVMGASKRIAEIYVQSLYKKLVENGNDTTKFITTRFGNVLGSNGSVIPLFKSQIEKGGPITVTHPEIIRYFMTIPEACTLVLEAGIMGNGGEIFIFDMGQPVKIVNLAKKMIRLAGFIPEVDIKIEFTGLRPGEKLYEELLNQKEITTKTHHPKIMIAKVQEYDYNHISSQIDELIKYSHLCKNFLTVSQMKKIVPEFKSKNSQYERLDV